MNRSGKQFIRGAGTLVTATLSSLLLLACAVTPSSPPGAAEARTKLSALQNDPNLAGRAPVEIRDAEVAVRLAEQPVSTSEAPLGQHRVYMADHRVEIAHAKATTRYAEDQRAGFAAEREAARLAARTREANLARDDASRARDDASRARADASLARDEADSARRAADAARLAEAEAAADAARRAAELQRQIDALEAETTDRGLVLTLGDVLFATGSAELQSGAANRLNKLVSFLNQYPERRVQIEGHTDNVGSSVYNQELSQQRAESVRLYLTQRGIGWQRLSATGMGLNQPIADNGSAAGRQQNRRVEIIIENPPLVSNVEYSGKQVPGD